MIREQKKIKTRYHKHTDKERKKKNPGHDFKHKKHTYTQQVTRGQATNDLPTLDLMTSGKRPLTFGK